ncbi:yciC [Symbiodinium microadriaticum]|nr:yciC [Symbiodinium microadriaticum]
MHAFVLTASPMEAAGFRILRPAQRRAAGQSAQLSRRCLATPPAQGRGALAATATAFLAAGCSALRQSRRRWRRCQVSLARPATATETAAPERVPVILLSGFLGTGKTTLLRHWLENTTDRVGIVVNDVASVNIDSKLVQQQSYNAEGEVNAIQLANGCACCSLGDELLVDISDLIELSGGERPFKQIVVELSGVAEPARVCENFASAREAGYYVVNGVELGQVVTVLDASTFCEEYMEYSRLYEREDLMDGDVGEMAEVAVVELLVEQTEAADIVILNKTDMATKEQLDLTREVVKAINKKARIIETTFGKVTLQDVLAEDHSEARHDHCDHAHEEHGHEGHHDDTHAEHGHGHEEEHSQAHSHASDCSEPGCSDASHGHSHSHADDCSDPDCTDHSHGHDHGHAHSHSTTTAEDRFGITSFTYRARRPLSEQRFTEALQKWPIPKHSDLKLMLDDTETNPGHPLRKVIRSKGFCWLETQPATRVYWSQAGKDMQLTYNGLWWGAMTQDQVKLMQKMATGEYDRARREDWDDEWCDRRQELVFIGRHLDEAAIRSMLDKCLLTDDEHLGQAQLMLSCVQRCHTRQEFCNQNQTKSADSHELTASTPTMHRCRSNLKRAVDLWFMLALGLRGDTGVSDLLLMNVFCAPDECAPSQHRGPVSRERTANDINTCQRAGEAITGKAFDDFSLSRLTGSKTYQPQVIGKCVRLLQSFGNVCSPLTFTTKGTGRETESLTSMSKSLFIMDAAQEYLKAQLLPQEEFAQGSVYVQVYEGAVYYQADTGGQSDPLTFSLSSLTTLKQEEVMIQRNLGLRFLETYAAEPFHFEFQDAPSVCTACLAILPAGRPARLSASTAAQSSRTSSAQRPQRPSVVSSRTMKLHSIRIRQISPPVVARAGESTRRPSVVSSRRPSTVSNASVTRVCHGSLEASTRTTVLGSSLVCSTASGRSMSPVWIARGMAEAKHHIAVPQSRTTSPLLGSSLRSAATEVKRAPLAPFNWQVSKPGKDVTSLATRTVSTRSAASSAPSSSSTPIVPLSGISLPMTNEQASDVAEAIGGITAGRKNVRFCPEEALDPKANLEEKVGMVAGEKPLAAGRTPSYGGA